MSFHYRRHAPPKKRANFTNKVESRPSRQVRIPSATCEWCSMKSTARCEIPSCNKPLCDRHQIRKAGGRLCPDHKGAILNQFDAAPDPRFGNCGGDAVPYTGLE